MFGSPGREPDVEDEVGRVPNGVHLQGSIEKIVNGDYIHDLDKAVLRK